jgi:zinc finger SWIM domain-containing protein 3
MDATYKLTNSRMLLYIILAIGASGESEIVAFFLTSSEDTLTLTDMLETFQNKTEKWSQIVTVFTDKDMTERDSIQRAFPNASLLLCLFHVLRSMSREVTTTKMGITEDQRISALKALQGIAYATSDEEYNTKRDDLHRCLPASIVRYYEANWHSCKEEWVRCWQQQNLTFGERTTNRLESINKRIKAVVNLLSPLPIFFKDLFAVIDCMRRERDHAFIVGSERISVKAALRGTIQHEFSNIVTSLALDFVLQQLEEAEKLNIVSENDLQMAEIGGHLEVINENDCQCIFKKSMGLSCKHIFAVRKIKGLPLVSAECIASRWLKENAMQNHRLFQQVATSESTFSVGLVYKRPLTSVEKFRRANRLCQRLAQLAAEGGRGRFDMRLTVLKNLTKL